MSEDSSASTRLNEFMKIMKSPDPQARLNLLAELFQKSNSERNKEEAGRLKEKYDILKEKYNVLRREYDILVDRNNYFASAFGACPFCFGSDTTCNCQGRGGPGTGSLNMNILFELIQNLPKPYKKALTDFIQPSLNES